MIYLQDEFYTETTRAIFKPHLHLPRFLTLWSVHCMGKHTKIWLHCHILGKIKYVSFLCEGLCYKSNSIECITPGSKSQAGHTHLYPFHSPYRSFEKSKLNYQLVELASTESASTLEGLQGLQKQQPHSKEKTVFLLVFQAFANFS